MPTFFIFPSRVNVKNVKNQESLVHELQYWSISLQVDILQVCFCVLIENYTRILIMPSNRAYDVRFAVF